MLRCAVARCAAALRCGVALRRVVLRCPVVLRRVVARRVVLGCAVVLRRVVALRAGALDTAAVSAGAWGFAGVRLEAVCRLRCVLSASAGSVRWSGPFAGG
ncbi:hypothetical protein Sm713_62170 [Streptomyces sp. TS71-3]|nr:hypothetical protein Sm713_62170 [Streptomyces sp. TS71-3]